MKTYTYSFSYLFSLGDLLETIKDIEEPIRTILELINIQNQINKQTPNVNKIGSYINDVDDKNDHYKYDAYMVNTNGINYTVNIGIDVKHAFMIKVVIKDLSYLKETFNKFRKI